MVGLEELDQVGGWILEEDLVAALAGDDLGPEPGALSMKSLQHFELTDASALAQPGIHVSAPVSIGLTAVR